MRFRMLTDEVSSTVYGEHSITYEIKNAPKDADEIDVCKAFMESPVYRFTVPYGTCTVERLPDGTPYRIKHSYCSSG